MVGDVEGLLKLRNVKETPLYERLSEEKVRCGVCERKCVVPSGEVGFCKTRINIGGRLYTLVYGDISSLSVNPIEKKPFFHFHPGSRAFTVGTWSCNLTCPWCQNWDISKCPPEPFKANYLSPEAMVSAAVRERCHGLSISFNEPTMLFEYSLDLFPKARRRGLYNTYVSNGYMTVEVLRMLQTAGMDAIKFDVKGDAEAVKRYCGIDVEKVWRNVGEAKKLGLHVEVVVLVIPGVNDDDDSLQGITQRHLERAGSDTALHFTRFYPAYEVVDRPSTPIETLEKAYRIARAEGLNYVYLGNVAGHRLENTYCPRCGELLIERYGLSVVKNRVKPSGCCSACGLAVPIQRKMS